MPATGDGRTSATTGTDSAADAAAHRPGTAPGAARATASSGGASGGTAGHTRAAAESTGTRPPSVRARTGAPAGGSPCEGSGSEGSGSQDGSEVLGPAAAARREVGVPIPHPRAVDAGAPAGEAARSARPRGAMPPYRLLVIQDSSSDVELIDTLVAGSAPHIELHRACDLGEATALLFPAPGSPRRSLPNGGFNCVLLDLAASGSLGTPIDGEGRQDDLPGRGFVAAPDAMGDADGLAGLRELLRRAPSTAVVVLTDAAGAELGAAAVAAGAQDFLIKQETDGPLLARALRYAVERKRADESQRRLVEAELRGQENARLQRHLLPTPLLDGANLSFTRRYRPGRRRALLGGDFYDAVRTDDGAVHVVIGDVCGHGPDEAALGVALRIAWRTLVFAGLTGQALLTTLQHVLEHERRSDEIFATLCMLVIHPGPHDPAAPTERAELFLAGHPAPLLLGPENEPVLLPTEQAGPALGLLPCDDGLAAWPAQQVELPAGWRVMLYTDGLVEGRVGEGSRRLGQEGLLELMADHQVSGLSRGRLVDSALAEVEELNGGALADDVAVLLLERNQPHPLMG